MLLLRDLAFFLFSASVWPPLRSMVALSLSMALVDLRVRRVAESLSPAIGSGSSWKLSKQVGE